MHFPLKPFQDCSNSPRPLDHSSQKVSQLLNFHFFICHSLSLPKKLAFYFLLLIAVWLYYYLEEINSLHISEKKMILFWEILDPAFAANHCTPSLRRQLTLNLILTLIYLIYCL